MTRWRRSQERSRDGGGVVLVHRYFAPDSPPYASMLSSIGTHLALEGFSVQVLTSQPSYLDTGGPGSQPRVETVGGVRVHRLPLLPELRRQKARRIVNLVLFAGQASVRVLTMRPAPAAVMACTTPPVLVALLVSMAARIHGAKFVYHCQDIHPEVLLKEDKPARWRATLLGLLRRLDISSGHRAASIVVLSRDMKAVWEERGVDAAKISIINNFDQERSAANDSSGEVPAIDDAELSLVFAGNIGRFQSLDIVVRGVAAATRNVHLYLVGDGERLEETRALAAELAPGRFTFTGRMTPAAASSWVRACDLAVVSLAPKLIRYVYPSKTFSYLAAGTPVLAVVEPDSELCDTLISSGAGIAVTALDAQGVAAAIDSVDLSRCRSDMRAAALDLSVRESRERRLDDWSVLYRGLIDGSTGPAR